MRRFVLLAHRVPVDGQFTLNDLAGGGGRMDEVARAVSTAFTLSNDLRRDVEFSILFGAAPPPRARRIEIRGDRVRYLNPDERSTAALLKNALSRSSLLDQDVESSPGLRVGPVDPLRELDRWARSPGALWLTEDGTPIDAWAPTDGSFVAILSDPDDPSPEERSILDQAGTPKVSLGVRKLRTSQCIDLVHYAVDRRGADRPTGRSS
ncbi:MAG TPA: tRNA (pseudouridine(54)-N(1))-methyltransferase TrmY [Thermoplasmata archaeon]|nr:tRNA (pseudouridine(54)-N(1))-methyltransferase TrmY [Thermoplasmata archaeon]